MLAIADMADTVEGQPDDQETAMSDTPDIQPERMSATDVASLAPIETYAVLVHLAGNPDPVVTAALIDATRRVLGRTRGRLRDRPPGWDQPSTGTSPS
jgi:hypothetical protein